MFVLIYILLLLTPSFLSLDGRSIRHSDQIMPLLFSSMMAEDGNTSSPSLNGQNRLLLIIEQIIKYISTIKSSERFIDHILDRQKDPMDKIQTLKFLRNCFRITDTFIQRSIHHRRVFSSSFTFEQLEHAHQQLQHLLNEIQSRMNTLKTWIPPTMPFLNF